MVKLKMGLEPAKGIGECLGQDSGFANRRREIRVADPSWQDVQVEMVCDACAGSTTKIHPNVITIWSVLSSESELSSLRQIHQFIGHGLLGFCEQPNVGIRRN